MDRKAEGGMEKVILEMQKEMKEMKKEIIQLGDYHFSKGEKGNLKYDASSDPATPGHGIDYVEAVEKILDAAKKTGEDVTLVIRNQQETPIFSIGQELVVKKDSDPQEILDRISEANVLFSIRYKNQKRLAEEGMVPEDSKIVETLDKIFEAKMPFTKRYEEEKEFDNKERSGGGGKGGCL